ncbi:sensor histidine kinase [Bdellovibrio sp. GT3]|uniref:sensor histidine kinase n=1 Tax=Bdellovibrio sp. GT3 TaxID=3136282 RepID=UPI0030F24BF6
MSSSLIKAFWPESSTLIQGIVRFRWIAIFFMMLGTVPLLQAGYLLKEQLFYFMAVIALLAVFNGLTLGIWSKAKAAQEQSLLFVQLLVDLFAVAGLLFVSGSAVNPFIYVLTLHAFLGGMLLRKRSILFGVLIFVFLGILQFETNRDAAMTLNVDRRALYFDFLFQWVVVAGAWFVAHLFSGLLEKHEERIRSLQNRQYRADRLKSLGALAAGFSHEMATPLNSLKLRLDRGVRKLGDPVAAHAEIQQAQLSLDECISVFQKMAGVFMTSADGELQKLNVNSVLQDIVRSWEIDNKTSINKVVSERQFYSRLQPLSFAQMILDLLDNALEASQAPAEITLKLYQDDQEVVIEVVDNGAGLAAEVIERLGEPFNTNKQQGNGLGVYSAILTAQSMGGEFLLGNNSSGKGATARLSLPFEERG